MTYHLSSWMMFSSLSKNHALYEKVHILGWRGSVQRHMTLALKYGTLFQMNIKLFYHLEIWDKNKKLDSRDLPFQVMQNIY